MKYSYEFKSKCVELYLKGIGAETSETIKAKSFRITIRKWVRIEDCCGPEGFCDEIRLKAG